MDARRKTHQQKSKTQEKTQGKEHPNPSPSPTDTKLPELEAKRRGDSGRGNLTTYFPPLSLPTTEEQQVRSQQLEKVAWADLSPSQSSLRAPSSAMPPSCSSMSLLPTTPD